MALFFFFQPTPGLSLVQLEKELRTRVDKMSIEKHERIKIQTDLQKKEQRLCDVLCATPHYIPSNIVPSRKQLKDLEVHIESLVEEKVKNAIVV